MYSSSQWFPQKILWRTQNWQSTSRLMQTERFNILVGPEQRPFKVPEDLLIMHSLVFKRMCSAPFIESNQRLIKLPEEDSSVSEDFFEWMHSSRPQASARNGTKATFDLAIFAEKYQICDLKTQISDLIREDNGTRRLNPRILDRVYSSVPKGAVLRQLCSWIMKWEADNWGELSQWVSQYRTKLGPSTRWSRPRLFQMVTFRGERQYYGLHVPWS